MGIREKRAVFTGGGFDIKTAVVAGAAADTNITVPGIKRGDEIVLLLEFQPPTAGSGSAIVAERSAVAKITAPNTIQLTVATTGNQLLVHFWSF